MNISPTNNPLRYFGEREILNLGWRKWYAWRPVKLQCGNWAWLIYIYHRKNILELTRKPTASPGDFYRSAKLKNRICVLPEYVAMEKLSGKVSYYDRMRDFDRTYKEGTFEL